MSDEQLIERIRATLTAEAADLDPPADLLARTRRVHAIDGHRSQRRSRWLGPIPIVGGVITLVAGSAVAVAVVAIALVGHGRPRAVGAPGVPAGARQLVSTLAVLRRAQTKADRGLPGWAVHGLVEGAARESPLPSLTRLVATLPGPAPGGVRIFLVVQAPATGHSDGPGPRIGDRVTELTVSHNGERGTDSVTAADLYQPVNMLPSSGSGPAPSGYYVTIVPDGVTRVRWTLDGQTHHVADPLAIHPTVRNNVAFAPTAGNQRQVTGVTWYGADGRIIKQVRQGGPGPAPFRAPGKLLAQIDLRPPRRPSANAAGLVDVFKNGANREITLTARRLTPNRKGNAYAVWLYNSPSDSRVLGFVNPGVKANRRLHAAGLLPPDAAKYKKILITLETSPNPRTLGKVVLQGGFRLR